MVRLMYELMLKGSGWGKIDQALRIEDSLEFRKNIPCNMINCFCQYSDYEPLTLDEWIECDKRRLEKISY